MNINEIPMLLRREIEARIAAPLIEAFIQEFGLDRSEFARQATEFENFNAFFSRALKPEARPIDPDPSVEPVGAVNCGPTPKLKAGFPVLIR